jgi:hypothetical protein
MKSRIVLLLVVGAAKVAGLADAQDAAPAAIAVTFHITRSQTLVVEKNCRELDAWGTIEGQKVLLAYDYCFGTSFALKPGDYPAHLTSDKVGSRGIERRYDVVVQPGKTLNFELIGLEE